MADEQAPTNVAASAVAPPRSVALAAGRDYAHVSHINPRSYHTPSTHDVIVKAERMAKLRTELDNQIKTKIARERERLKAERETDLQDLMYRQCYSGFGRPGCGAPLRNPQGLAIANLGDVFNGDERVQAVPLSPPRHAKFKIPPQYLVESPASAVGKSRLGYGLKPGVELRANVELLQLRLHLLSLALRLWVVRLHWFLKMQPKKHIYVLLKMVVGTIMVLSPTVKYSLRQVRLRVHTLPHILKQQ